MRNALDGFYLFNKFLRLFYFSISAEDNMRINTENTGAYLVLKPRHDGNNNNKGHNTDGNTDDRDPCRKRNESLFSFRTQISKTNICLVIQVALTFSFVFSALFNAYSSSLKHQSMHAGYLYSTTH